MDRKSLAMDAFDAGLNFCEAVFSALTAERGLDEAAAIRIGAAFGGGMARQGLTCGAVTGAYMAFGWVLGPESPAQKGKLSDVYTLCTEFSRRFTRDRGSLSCRELLGIDLGTPEGQAAFKERGLKASVCAPCVARAVEIGAELRGKAAEA